ncbi:hypothetical protein Tco_0149165 [Tanacetum coccineum]
MFKYVRSLAGKTFQEEFRSAGWCKENKDRQKTIAEDMGLNPLVHSFRALSTLRHFGLRMASATAKPCHGDSSEFYLITGNTYTDKQGTVVLATLFNESEQRHFRVFITNVSLQESRR